jgi:hypothetical protein
MNEAPSPVQFLTAAESADVDQALLTNSEKFLTRLTLSSWKLLQKIAEDKQVAVENLSHQQIIDWFEQDSKIKREQGIESAVLKW